ncbi:MAG: hypothetical protein ACEY3F_02070, partial [Wolbachia sp.]
RHNWIEHLYRHDYVVNINEGKISGKKGISRPRLAYIKQAIQYTGTNSYFIMKRMTSRRERWSATNQSMD